jgi:hypothetical protein
MVNIVFDYLDKNISLKKVDKKLDNSTSLIP